MNFRIKEPIIPFLILVLSCVAISRVCHGVDYETNKSTNPVTASTLSIVPDSNPGDILGSLLINSGSVGNETITLYDSSGTASGVIGVINVSSGVVRGSNEYRYNLRISSAITFTKSAGSSNLTIIWKDVR